MTGTKTAIIVRSRRLDSSFIRCSFETELGWGAADFVRTGISRMRFGYPTGQSALRALGGYDNCSVATNRVLCWIEMLQEYAAGKRVDITKIPSAQNSPLSSFAKRVRGACRSVRYGETLTYGQLAEIAGAAGAARAVGSVMRKNETPLIVPCHRVVSSQGIGGYSSIQGVAMKQRLLRMESRSA